MGSLPNARDAVSGQEAWAEVRIAWRAAREEKKIFSR
jgi:hypothetical protein